MAIEIFTGTLAQCNAVIAKANTAMGYSVGTSIDIPTEIDATTDEYEVAIKTGTQKNSLDVTETAKVATTRSFEAKDKLEAKLLVFVEQAVPSYKAITRLSLTDSGRRTITAGGTNTITAAITPSNAGDLKLHWTSSDTSKATVQNTTGLTCIVTANKKARGTVSIKCNSTDGSRVSASTTLSIR
tara:strand:+ start:765 stop:1319 length:555 start_codon:yes stop_codon:yes gene_type:complete